MSTTVHLCSGGIFREAGRKTVDVFGTRRTFKLGEGLQTLLLRDESGSRMR